MAGSSLPELPLWETLEMPNSQGCRAGCAGLQQPLVEIGQKRRRGRSEGLSILLKNLTASFIRKKKPTSPHPLAAQTQIMGLNAEILVGLGGFSYPEWPRTCLSHCRSCRLLKSSGSCSQQGFILQDLRPVFPGVRGLAGLCELPVRTPRAEGQAPFSWCHQPPRHVLDEHQNLDINWEEQRSAQELFTVSAELSRSSLQGWVVAKSCQKLPKSCQKMSRRSFSLLAKSFHGTSVPRKKPFHWIFQL